jgi:hypothetical protein
MHAAHNLFIQAIFNLLTSDTGITEYVIDEFGIGLALIVPVVAYLFWRKRNEVETIVEAPPKNIPEFAPAP